MNYSSQPAVLEDLPYRLFIFCPLWPAKIREMIRDLRGPNGQNKDWMMTMTYCGYRTWISFIGSIDCFSGKLKMIYA